jgi:CHAT domain-containing protein
MVRFLAGGGSVCNWRGYGLVAVVGYALAIPTISSGAEPACGDAAPDAEPKLRPLAQADCYAGNGEVARAVDTLQASLAAEPRDRATTIATYARLGQLQLSLGLNTAALDALSSGLRLAAEDTVHDESAAGLLNDLGRAYVDADRPLEALAAFADSARFATAAQAELAVTARLNLLRALAESRPAGALGDRLDTLRAAALALQGSAVKAEILLALARLQTDVAADGSARESRAAIAAELARAALTLAEQHDDAALRADAHGQLGQAYAAMGDVERALALTREAELIAQRAGLDGTLYRWEWQAGRLLRTLNRNAESLQAYQAAIDTLGATPIAAVTSRRAFQADVLPLYEEYADLMLASSRRLEGAAANAVLGDVQRSVERLRVAEVRNYFENQCSVPDAAAAAGVLGTGALVIYPMLFADRVEILVSTGDSLRQFTTYVGLPELERTVRLLREAIENSESASEYLAHAQRLYSWLVAPLADVLEQTAPSTLVLVPDGALRTVPFGVLHDGERFLVERYALATTPALSLIGAVNVEPVSRVLVNGLSAPVQGFAALPFVTQELRSIAETMPSRVYADESFVTATLEREILEGGYSIVHMATHAQFEADYRRSFLLAYDDVITLDELEDVMGSQRFTDAPIDLLVLSACQTAVGDERAALGLAGVAVKAGARSALASLWHINDESTALLVAEFYRQLAASTGRAAALRGAQLRLLNEPRYSHPAHWAPFLMIGDWR